MMDQDETLRLESRLLSACAKIGPTPDDETTIRQLLGGAIDWTHFAQEAVDRGIAGRAGQTLARIAPDLIPDDILGAFSAIIDKARAENSALLDEIATIVGTSPRGALVLKDTYAAAGAALADDPHDAAVWRDLGNKLNNFGRTKAAIACLDRAIVLAPDDARSWRDRGIAMFALGQRLPALTYLDKALALNGEDALAWTYRAHALAALERISEAVEASDRALTLDPSSTSAARVNIHALLFSCDWRRHEDLMRRARDGIRLGQAVITPFNHLAISSSEEENLAVARIWANGVPQSPHPLWRGERYKHERIRIAYISTDFRETLSVNAIAGGFEGHDKSRFEMTAISLAPSDGSHTRRRIEAAFDRFVDVQDMSDAQVAEMLREFEIDVAIDLNGYAGNKRSGILAHRPAPIQVNYLGFAGTMGMPFFDYIIADSTVIPPEHHRFFSEKVVYLPLTFFPTDRKRRISERTPTRTELGLPETGCVFTCQNTVYKITPEIFDVWMRLLRTIDGSVLWLAAADELAAGNLRREARSHGVAQERLVFGSWVAERADHLARLRLADLFLDTLPYNAHTTACDALWAGLPIVTCLGNTFPARVAASLLHAIGLPELVTASLAEYEHLARTLARDGDRLAAIKSKLSHNRDSAGLFDTTRFTRHLEAAYIGMWERYQAGLAPAAFAVDG